MSEYRFPLHEADSNHEAHWQLLLAFDRKLTTVIAEPLGSDRAYLAVARGYYKGLASTRENAEEMIRGYLEYLDSKPTPGPWREGKGGSCVVADVPVADWGTGLSDLSAEIAFYGGFLVAETVAHPNMPLICAAPDLLAAAAPVVHYLEAGNGPSDAVGHGLLVALRAAVEKATRRG